MDTTTAATNGVNHASVFKNGRTGLLSTQAPTLSTLKWNGPILLTAVKGMLGCSLNGWQIGLGLDD